MFSVRPNWIELDRLRVLFTTQESMDYLARELTALGPELVYKQVINNHQVGVSTIFGPIILEPSEIIVVDEAQV